MGLRFHGHLGAHPSHTIRCFLFPSSHLQGPRFEGRFSDRTQIIQPNHVRDHDPVSLPSLVRRLQNRTLKIKLKFMRSKSTVFHEPLEPGKPGRTKERRSRHEIVVPSPQQIPTVHFRPLYRHDMHHRPI